MASASPLTRSSYHAGDDFARLKAARAHVLTSEEPTEVRRRVAATYDAFGWRMAA